MPDTQLWKDITNEELSQNDVHSGAAFRRRHRAPSGHSTLQNAIRDTIQDLKSVFVALDSPCQSREWQRRCLLRVNLECSTKIHVHQLSCQPVDRRSSLTPSDSSPPIPSVVSPFLTPHYPFLALDRPLLRRPLLLLSRTARLLNTTPPQRFSLKTPNAVQTIPSITLLSSLDFFGSSGTLSSAIIFLRGLFRRA
ncbi:hypothetical protein K443DRAFT_13445 [Laccaria amethystina LaAM-08-1]|uniref:Uncharacterized protein n=1 Tax=Laccaria amethystina LaAM-08-1 TaxID=1095629 RepID=A0A0C9WP96_9AGAR|nr:hypothetical protein K443DRAFT_13445 [Laccaria amethystina LaAM-08-1]